MEEPRNIPHILSDVFPSVATWQGHICYTLFSIYAVNPNVFHYYLGRDPGPFFFANMIYGNAVHIYTRPVMKKLGLAYRICHCIYGTYCFNFSSLLLFFALGEAYGQRPLFVSILSYCVGKIMYSMFYSFYYFVDKLADSGSRRGESVMDILLGTNR